MAVARLTGISDQSLRRWATFDRAEAAKIRGPNQIKLAKLFEYETWESFVAAAESTPILFASADKFLADRGSKPANNILPDFERHYGEPANIQHAPKQIPSIPEWTAEIACGHWIDCAAIAMDMDNDVQADTARRGMFIVRVMGDSMKPTYKPGNRVLFRVVRLDDEPLRIGADYYWQNSDGQCTLKRLKSIGEDEYTLAPLNRKYKPLKLAKQMLAKVAIVETIVTARGSEAQQKPATGRVAGEGEGCCFAYFCDATPST